MEEDASANEGTGFAGSLSGSQALALAELRGALGVRIGHPRFTDVLLLRFLRAKQFDARAAGELLEGHLAFRERHGLDGPAWGNPHGLGPAARAFPEMPVMKRYYPHAFHKTDRQGRPLYIERLGQLDVPGLLAQVTTERLLEYFAYESERQTTHRLPACSLAHGSLVESTMSILDLDGLGFRTVTNSTVLRVVRSIMREQNENFPEVTGNLVIVNAPTSFSLIWSAIKPLLSASTTEKIEVFRAGNTDYQTHLLEFVAPENLPAFLGGTCRCEGVDGGCMCSDAGPWCDADIERTLLETPHWEVLRRLMPGPGAHDAEASSAQHEAGSLALAETMATGSASAACLHAEPLAAAMEGDRSAPAEATAPKDEQPASAEVLAGEPTGIAVPGTEVAAASGKVESASAKATAAGSGTSSPCDEAEETCLAAAEAAVLESESVPVPEAKPRAVTMDEEQAASAGSVHDRMHSLMEFNSDSAEATGDNSFDMTLPELACQAGEQTGASKGHDSAHSESSAQGAEARSDHISADSNNNDSNAASHLIAAAKQPEEAELEDDGCVREPAQLDMASFPDPTADVPKGVLATSFHMGRTGDEVSDSTVVVASENRLDDLPSASTLNLTDHGSDSVVQGVCPGDRADEYRLVAGPTEQASHTQARSRDDVSSPMDQSSSEGAQHFIKRWILGDSCLSIRADSAVGLSGSLQADPGSLQPHNQGPPCPGPESTAPLLGSSVSVLEDAVSHAPRVVDPGDMEVHDSSPGTGRVGAAGCDTTEAEGYEHRYSRDNVVRWLSETTFRAIGPLITCGPRNL